MKSQMAYIPGTLYDNFDVDGKPKTKEQLQREAIQKESYKKLHGGKTRPEFQPTELQVKKYNQWLEEFQEDIRRIIGKYRLSHHLLSAEELTSEINLSLVKKRSSLILYIKTNKGFNQQSFKHSAFIYSRNLVKWSHWSLCNRSYVKRRVDGTVYDEKDGFKSKFEAIIEKEGFEEKGFLFDDKNKQKVLLKIIKEYSSLLTENQKIIFTHLQKGLTHEEIAKKMGVTHQAVSLSFVEIKNKVRAYFNGISLKDNSFDKVREGKEAIKSFFEGSKDKITEKDRDKIQTILHLNPYRYTSKQIAAHFFENKYSHRQISSCCVKKGWAPLLKKIRNIIEFDKEELIELLKNNISKKEISEIMGVSIRSLRSRIGHLKRKKLINI